MKRYRVYNLLTSILAVAVVLCGCDKSDDETSIDKMIGFGISLPEVATRVTVSDTENSNGKFDVTFDDDDQIGLYLYYNNFYEYYAEWSTYAESVIFANQLITPTAGGTLATYSPIKSWTFSTIYGTQPYKYDAIAYYPYTDNGAIVSKWSGASSNILIYYYDPSILDRHCDFMVGTATYVTDKSDPGKFREDILAGSGNVALKFTREMASVNLRLRKIDTYASETIEVKGMTLSFDSYNRFVYNQSAQDGKWDNGDDTAPKMRYTLSLGATEIEEGGEILSTTAGLSS